MNIVLTETQTLATPAELRALYPEVGFPPESDWTNAMLADYGAAVLIDDPQPTLGTLESLQYGAIREEDGNWYRAWVVVPGTTEQWTDYSTDELQSRQRQANAQVTALSGRVATLDYLINQQDPDDEDYIEPSAAEIAELPVRKAQLKSWNSYNVKLGRVSAAAGWPSAPAWPTMPEPYTNETSAVAPQTS